MYTYARCCRPSARQRLLAFLLPLAFIASYQAGFHFFQRTDEEVEPAQRVFVWSELDTASMLTTSVYGVGGRKVSAFTITRARQRDDDRAAVAAAAAHRRYLNARHRRRVSEERAITIIGFTNYGMLDFALNWLVHLEDAIGKRLMRELLLIYCVGEDTKDALVASGFVTREMIRHELIQLDGLLLGARHALDWSVRASGCGARSCAIVLTAGEQYI